MGEDRGRQQSEGIILPADKRRHMHTRRLHSNGDNDDDKDAAVSTTVAATVAGTLRSFDDSLEMRMEF